jgi:hypothetical protein
MLKKFDYVAAALAGFVTTAVLLISLPAHAQSVAHFAAQQPPAAVADGKIC